MKIKMLESFQGVGQFGRLVEEDIVISLFSKGDILEVDRPLGDWLVENKKAEEIKPVVYGGKPIEPEAPFVPELRHDDEIVQRPRKRRSAE
jgi:hypothetical protein